jgi:hypothetical protein
MALSVKAADYVMNNNDYQLQVGWVGGTENN